MKTDLSCDRSHTPSDLYFPAFHVGEIVRTSYGTGPFRITKVSELCCCPEYIAAISMSNPPASTPHYHLTCEPVGRHQRGAYYLNGYLPTGESVWCDDRLIFPFRSQPFLCKSDS